MSEAVKENQNVVMAARAANVAGSAASTASSATSVKPGGAVPALMGAQRFSMYGDAASGTSTADKACQPYTPNYLMFQFGLWQLVEPSVAPALGLPPNPLNLKEADDTNATNSTNGTALANGTAAATNACGSSRRLQEWDWDGGDAEGWGASPFGFLDSSGRRLQRKGGGGGGGNNQGGKKRSAEVDYMLLAALGDQVTSGLAILIVLILVHEFLLLLFGHCINRKFYRALREEQRTGVLKERLPKFRALPTALVFPRFHVTLFTVVITGLMQTGANVLGTFLGPYEVASGLVGFSVLTVLFVCGALTHQALKVQLFYKKYIVCERYPHAMRAHLASFLPHTRG